MQSEAAMGYFYKPAVTAEVKWQAMPSIAKNVELSYIADGYLENCFSVSTKVNRHTLHGLASPLLMIAPVDVFTRKTYTGMFMAALTTSRRQGNNCGIVIP